MLNKQSYKQSYFWLLLALATALLLFRLNATPIYILDEAKNAQCAREMLQRSDFIVPTFNEELRTDKPVLHYYFMMAGYTIFGFNEFGARFFSTIMGLLTILITYIYTRKYLDAFTGFCSALVLVMSTHFLFEFRLAVPDPYLICFIALGLFSGFSWLQENKISQLFIAVTALGLATLAKGPVALALPGLCLLIWIILKKKWHTIFTWKLIPAFLLLCLIVLPWYLAVDKATDGKWTQGFFLDHNLNRFADPQEGHGGIFLITILFILIGLLPFAIFTGEIFRKRISIFNSDLVKFSGIVVLVFVVFFSVASTRLPNYAMPCYPFAAILLGRFIASLMNGDLQSKKYPLYILTIFTLLIPAAGYFAIGQEPELHSFRWIALWLLVVPAAFVIVLFINKPANWSSAIIRIGLVFTLFNIIGLHYIYPKLYSQNPVAKTIETVKKSPVLIAYKIYNPGYNFYLNTSIPKYDDIESLKRILHQNPEALVISRKEFLDALQSLNLKVIAEHRDLFELPTTVILQHAP